MNTATAFARLMFLALTAAWCGAQAQPEQTPQTPERHWLAERAATSDYVVLARLDRVDYEYERDFPIDGEAWFRPLIHYKPRAASDSLLIVHEKGLHDNECYFPEINPVDEPPRYLLFLVEDPERERLRGHPDGCAIEVLVTAENRYAARWPQPALGGTDGQGDAALQARVKRFTFQGPSARIDAGDMLAHRRRARAEREHMELDGQFLIPTRGIALGELRELMQPGLDLVGEGGSRSLRELRERVRATDG